MTLEQRVPWLRDIICLGLGTGGFIHSLATEAGWPPLLMSAVLLAGPSVLHFWVLGHTPGAALSSVPASPAPPSPSPLPSSAPSAGEGR